MQQAFQPTRLRDRSYNPRPIIAQMLMAGVQYQNSLSFINGRRVWLQITMRKRARIITGIGGYHLPITLQQVLVRHESF